MLIFVVNSVMGLGSLFLAYSFSKKYCVSRDFTWQQPNILVALSLVVCM